MTRAKVIELGLVVLALGAVLYEVFKFLGLEGASAGIASEAILIALIVVWTGSYLLRVVTGKMTFMEQRKRYRKAYEELTNDELQARLDSMSDEEQMLLMKELEDDEKSS